MGIKFWKKNDKFEIQIFDDLSDVRLLRYNVGLWLEDLKNISPYKMFSVKLCLEESIFNAMQHAYDEKTDQQKIVDIVVEKINDSLSMSIRDYGQKEWFKDYEIPETIELNKIDSMHGRGLIIIKALSQALTITNNKGQGTQVDIKINLLEN